MVVVQLLAIGHVQDNRVARRSAKAAKQERERVRRERLEKLGEKKTHGACSNVSGIGSYLDGGCDIPEDHQHDHSNGVAHEGNGHAKRNGEKTEEESEESMTETSEEEIIV